VFCTIPIGRNKKGDYEGARSKYAPWCFAGMGWKFRREWSWRLIRYFVRGAHPLPLMTMSDAARGYTARGIARNRHLTFLPMATKHTGRETKPTRTKTRQGPPSALLVAVGERIRAVRQEKGISQDKLAYSIPLDRAHIGMIENGKRAATIPTLAKLAVALGCEVGDFFPGLEELSTLVEAARKEV
jgi:DNA-binding XRE family transcriptional regulator